MSDNTTFVDPVEVVVPVPPLIIGNAVPERLIANVPEVVIGDPEILKKVGTVAATEVTVPEVAGVVHAGDPATTVRIVPLAPTHNPPQDL